MSTILATITVKEQASPSDEYRTDNGQGHPDDCEPSDVEVITITLDDLSGDGDDIPDTPLQDAILAALADHGLTEWDGGSTAYDPDGSHMAADAAGTITTRFAHVDQTPRCPGCRSDQIRPARGYVLPSCYSCGLAWTTMG